MVKPRLKQSYFMSDFTFLTYSCKVFTPSQCIPRQGKSVDYDRLENFSGGWGALPTSTENSENFGNSGGYRV